MTSRRYDNSARELAARHTRRRILQAARTLIEAEGYPALSVAALARAAGVSPQTIYNTVGGKAEVLKACYDVTLAGDDEPVPMSGRPAFRAMFETADPVEFLIRYAAWSATVYDRVGAIVGSVGDRPDAGAADFLATIDRERRIGTTGAVTHFRDTFGLPAGVSLDRAVDMVWTLNSPEVYDRLVRRCGWAPADYQAWLGGQLAACLAPHPADPTS